MYSIPTQNWPTDLFSWVTGFKDGTRSQGVAEQQPDRPALRGALCPSALAGIQSLVTLLGAGQGRKLACWQQR